ncbi:hypothetical protein QR680_003616 [Steinernema hermaphroditum]|uniref:Oxidation resistance protein 1 n=1 Tax=Steinernema hermaphroditum TaxID=289476 RepID=A0AA39LSD7_9BILA|nr:hypothetical protein QR680_003616 [Steinernema hermaphroditum]
MHYEVKDNDTLERIAAAHDCTVGELMKLNKMASRMVFPGQRILVPAPAADDVFVDASSTHSSSNVSTNSSHTAPTNLGIYLGDGTPPLNDSFAEGKTRGPGGAVPIQSTNNRNNSPDEKTVVIQERIEDSDCLQRFLKIKVKQMTESDGTVSGTLLVTPNCLMFDPDVQHPLVIENGSDLYGMVANMDEILSVSVYKDIDGLTGAKATKKRSVFDPDHYRSPEEATSTAPIVEVAPDADDDKPKCDSGSESFESAVEDQPFASGTSLSGSGQMLTSIVEEDQHGQSDLLRPTEKYCGKRRTVSDVTSEQSEAFKEEHLSTQPLLSAGSETDVVVRPHTDLEPSTSVDSTTSLPGNNNNNNEKGSFFNRSSRYSPNVARRSFGRLGRTLSARASSVKGTVVSGTKTVVSHTKSAAGQVQTGIQSGARVIAQAPNNMVRMGSGLLHDVQDKPGQLMEIQTNATLKREQSLATLENLKQRTQQVRQEALKKQKQSMFHCATSSDEMPDLFKPISQMISQNSDSELATTPPELPYYMAVRLDKFKKKNHHRGGKYSVSSTSSYTSYDDDCKFGNRRKREFWYAIPRAKADAIYHFLLHWSPEKYGQDTLTNEESEAQKKSAGQKSFLVLEDDSLSSNEQPSVYSQSLLDRQWELVSVGEICRRLSLDDEILASDLPLPEGAKTSQILDEFMIRQILDILPPRAEGYPWIKIYSSEKHGFSLSTMYRKMAEWNEDMSPVLLIIRDTAGHVFGACVSTTIRPSEHYFGTGDSCLLFRFTGEYPHTRELRDYRWTGDNQFFVNAQKDSLSVGAGGGHYGLWLDADLNLGRTQRCQTFDNEPLTGGKMDFTVQFVEAFGFSM